MEQQETYKLIEAINNIAIALHNVAEAIRDQGRRETDDQPN